MCIVSVVSFVQDTGEAGTAGEGEGHEDDRNFKLNVFFFFFKETNTEV